MINNLRNHDKPCRHGELWHHTYQIVPEVLWCPGGEPVDIDYEAASLYALGDSAIRGGLVITYPQMVAIVDAALRLTDD